MGLIKNLRLGLIHAAMAVTLVPITGVLNRVMIHEMGILASLVAALIVLPHLLAPIQVVIGNFSDQHPLWGYRRTPYIALGTLLCIGGAVLTPRAALMMDVNFWPGLSFAILAFLGWGLGFNIAVVSYLSLASDLSSEEQRSRTIAIMWFMMITAVIATAIVSGRALEAYSEARLLQVFDVAGLIAVGIVALGLIGVEPRHTAPVTNERHSMGEALRAVTSNPQARIFFLYLMLLLAAILGQDVLLEPFGATAFGMEVRATTELTAIWGGMTLVSLLLQGTLLSRWLSKKQGALLGGTLAALGLTIIGISGILVVEGLFIAGIALLGFGTGIATATNLALMLDMTTPEQVGLFIGAWGIADALARGLGNLMGGVVRDLVAVTTGSQTGGYISVFLIEALMLCVALLMLRRIDVSAFRERQTSFSQVVSAMGDA